MVNFLDNRGNRILGLVVMVLGLAMNPAYAMITPSKKPVSNRCVPLGDWVVPGSGKVSQQQVIARAAEAEVVLLGETHVNADHHRWQLQTLTALHAQRPNMVIGFEMFPRRVQGALDRWVAGELTEQEFLRASDWNHVWNTDPNLYLPLFHFARMNRIPMLALNIETKLRRQVAEKGFYGVSLEEREGLTRPAEPSQAYLDYLMPIYKQHDRKNKPAGEISQHDPDFRRFIDGQLLWDRAMAQVLQQAVNDSVASGKPLVVGVMGSGHVLHGFGVPHQLHDLGIKNVSALLPWDNDKSCKQLVAGVADAVFGVLPHVPELFRPQFQRLGIRYEMGRGGAVVLQVEKNSVAEAANLMDSDVIVEMAGVSIKATDDVINVVKRQAPGTWLPIKIKRDNQDMEIIAKFPPIKT
ncbi:ChaN family lipoprotein [Nitrosomonas sp.]|uniref:ChaN family lipoprotein n=1 Tax=Nitrosomonas sp. TaxID=42353 RepID=UPI001DDDA429|nr:ChaN family lipoprotein [Nitrosomonas sp.]MBX3617440.1 ChaN family lipoprotein [Nitrosomonas sp.]